MNRNQIMSNKKVYNLALSIALASCLILIWVILAVGLLESEGSNVDLMYLVVIAIGISGSILFRLKPKGMATVLLSMAIGQILITIIALFIGIQHSAVSSVLEILLFNGFFVILFLVSAFLFRRAV